MDGSKVLIVAERDGNTVSPDRGVYLMDLSATVTVDEVRMRVTSALHAERITASGFWTTKIGMADLQYLGNTGVAEWKGCPEEVLKKLGLTPPA